MICCRVPFPTAAGAIRFGAPVEHLTETFFRHYLVSPFRAAKEKPASWLTEEVPFYSLFLLCPSRCGGATLSPLPPFSGGRQ